MEEAMSCALFSEVCHCGTECATRQLLVICQTAHNITAQTLRLLDIISCFFFSLALGRLMAEAQELRGYMG